MQNEMPSDIEEARQQAIAETEKTIRDLEQQQKLQLSRRYPAKFIPNLALPGINETINMEREDLSLLDSNKSVSDNWHKDFIDDTFYTDYSSEQPEKQSGGLDESQVEKLIKLRKERKVEAALLLLDKAMPNKSNREKFDWLTQNKKWQTSLVPELSSEAIETLTSYKDKEENIGTEDYKDAENNTHYTNLLSKFKQEHSYGLRRISTKLKMHEFLTNKAEN